VLLKEAIDLFNENMHITGKSNNTIYQYSLHLERFEAYLKDYYGHSLHLEEIKPDKDLDRYLFNILSKDKYADSTRNGMITAFKSFTKYCYRKAYTHENIGKHIQNIQYKTPEREYLNDLEYQQVIKRIVSPTAKAVLQTMFYTGVRVTECISIQLKDIDLDKAILKVKQGKGNKDRNIPLNRTIINNLKHYIKEGRIDAGTNNLFSSKSGKITKQYVNQVLKKAMEQTGITKQISSHNFRHSFASNLVEGKVDINRVKKLLGHSSLKDTIIYLHTPFEELQATVNLL